MKTTAARLALRLGVPVLALGLACTLTGCIQSSTKPSSSSPTETTAPSSAPPTDAATPTPTSTPQRFVENCTTLLTATQVYDYNPNYVVDPAYAPKPGSVPAAIAANLGQTCGWIDETSGTEIEVAITALDPDQWQFQKTTASSGTPISTAGEKGYFSVKNGVGSAQLFFGSIWLDVSSVDFATAADAQQLYPIVVQNQLHAGG